MLKTFYLEALVNKPATSLLCFSSLSRSLLVTLCSPDANVWVSTVKVIVVSPAERTVEWNYQMGFVPRAMATQPSKLRIYVYDITNMPKAKISANTRKKTWILAGAGDFNRRYEL